MKKILIAFLVFLALAITASALTRREDITTTRGMGNAMFALPNATITVYNSDRTTLATLATDSVGTPLANPVTSDSAGRYFYYVPNGIYNEYITKPGHVPQWRYDISVTGTLAFVASFNTRTGDVTLTSADVATAYTGSTSLVTGGSMSVTSLQTAGTVTAGAFAGNGSGLNIFSTTSNGIVPASNATFSTVEYLRGDATWTTPSTLYDVFNSGVFLKTNVTFSTGGDVFSTTNAAKIITLNSNSNPYVTSYSTNTAGQPTLNVDNMLSSCIASHPSGTCTIKTINNIDQVWYQTPPTGYYTRNVLGTDYYCDGGIYSGDSYYPSTHNAYVCDGTFTENNVTGYYGPTIYQCIQRMECSGSTSITANAGALGGNNFTAATICPVSAYTLNGTCSPGNVLFGTNAGWRQSIILGNDLSTTGSYTARNDVAVLTSPTSMTIDPNFLPVYTGSTSLVTGGTMSVTSLQTAGTVCTSLQTAGTVTAGAFVGPLTGNVTGNVSGSAATWTTARNLAGNSIDGSANVAFANKFIVQGTSDAGLSSAQFLGSLGTGIVKNTTITGALSLATGQNDFAGLTTTDHPAFATVDLSSSNGGFRVIQTPSGLTGISLSSSAVATVTVGTNPYGVAYSPTNDRVYVTNNTSSNVSVIRPSDNTVVATVTVGTNPHGVAYSPTNDRVYVTNYTSNNVSVIRPSDNTVVATVTVGTNPYGVAYSPTNDRVYVTNNTSSNVSVIRPSDNTVVATVTVGTSPYDVAYSPTNDRVYVANIASNNVSVIRPSDNTVVATVTVGTNPHGVAYSPTNDRVYVTNYTSNNVSVIRPSDNTVVATVTVGTNPHGVAYSPTNDRVYVTNYTSNNVSVIRPSDNTVVATVTVGTNPYGVIAYSPTNDRVYVANYTSNNVSVIYPSIFPSPTTLAGFGITDALSTAYTGSTSLVTGGTMSVTSLQTAGTVTAGAIVVNGRLSMIATAPTTTLCGTSAVVTGTDNGGSIAVTGSATTTCTLSFSSSWTQIYGCTVSAGDGTAMPYVSSISNASVVFTLVADSNPKLYYHCDGK